MAKAAKKELVVYKIGKSGVELRGDFSNETMWASLDQISEVFERDKSAISRHLKNIFNGGELKKEAIVAKNATIATDGKVYQVEYFNLDAIISVGYRVNSRTATNFRQWATKTLKDHLLKGYTVKEKQYDFSHYNLIV